MAASNIDSRTSLHPKPSRTSVPSLSLPLRICAQMLHTLPVCFSVYAVMISAVKSRAIALEMLSLACASICPWLISLNVTFRNKDGAFKDISVQMACRCLHCIIGIFANHCLRSCLMLSLKEVMVVFFITGMEMKGDLKECTLAGSKSHDLVVESSDAGGRRRQTSVC